MVRHKEYDRLDILDKVVNLFLHKGYKATSVSDIVQATGLNTASMYKEFGDKDGLFEEALEHYYQNSLTKVLQILIDEPNMKGVEAFLDHIINSAASGDYKGCLILNSIAEKNVISQMASEQVTRFCETLETLLKKAIGNAQKSGDLSTTKDPTDIANYIIFCLHGLVLFGRHPDKKTEIPKFYNVILQALKA